jgi:hypothetical protein
MILLVLGIMDEIVTKPEVKIVQTKKKGDDGIYVNLSSKRTGLNAGDAVQIEIMGQGIIILKKLEAIEFNTKGKKESTIDRILESFGLKEHIDYQVKS